MEVQMCVAFGKQLIRTISTSAPLSGKRNFRKFPLYNKRGTRQFKEEQAKNPNPEVPIHHYGVRPVGYKSGTRFVTVPEMIPEIIVPDLTGFRLKPYVSYRAADVVQPPMTPEELFGAVYVKKITDDFTKGKLDASNQPTEPSDEEKLTAEEAKKRVRRVNSDII